MKTTYTVIPAQAGIQKKTFSDADNAAFVPLCGDYSINWIPACAGMTRF